MSSYNQLKNVLSELFELDKADLDFGIYRIINQKRKQVNEFIEKKLPSDVKNALSKTQSSEKPEIENEIREFEKNAEKFKFDLSQNEEYIKLREKLKLAENTDGLEQEVFSHLANFFKRYYKDGDFISMRRYKKDVYAIPYEGEEVKLHWANHDQYYIKSSENFKNYSFKLADGKKVTFQLKEASTEQNNNKTQGDAERRFALFEELPVEEIDNELFINFIYEAFPKATKQADLLSIALDNMSQHIPANFSGVFKKLPTEKNKNRTVLEKHLNDYVSKNSFDYFIHKDLGGFLSRELDFYIKNEVLYLDDINTKQTEFFVAQLSKVKAIKTVAHKVIQFLAQIEDFQKKLWLKKKFVIRTDYCITLDKIPNSYYQEIFQNEQQLEEWKTLFDVKIINQNQLNEEPYLVLDTKFFDERFKDRLLAEFDSLDEQTNGLLISSENFQALSLISEKYQESVKYNYIDPPYNAKSSEIVYKNTFKHSSWLSLIENRLHISKSLLNSENGIFTIAIDENEQEKLGILLSSIFDETYQKVCVSVIHNPGGIQGNNFSYTHEFAYFIFKDKPFQIGYKNRIASKPTPLRDWGGDESLRTTAKNCFYPIYVKNGDIVGIGEVSPNNFNPGHSNITNGDVLEIYPIDSNGVERKWRNSFDSVKGILNELKCEFIGGEYVIRRYKSEYRYKTVWFEKEYNSNAYGSSILNDILGEKLFSFPKSINTVKDSIDLATKRNFNNIILDYFAGSGTTGHATIKLNREDGGNRKYILVEMGSYFDTVTKPRIQKVIYSDIWKNGKPQDKNGISQLVKYQVLESYEDTLNNLYLSPPADLSQLQLSSRAEEEYLIQYMLDVESRDQLFNLEIFRKPFDYQLKVTENNELKLTKVDLVETFNYLIGLNVSKIQRVKDIKVVEGITRTGIKTLVIWRDMDTTTHGEVMKLIRRFYDSERTKEFHQIYINGDNHLENLRQEEDTFKIKLIEETFFKKMFNEIEL